MSSFVLPVFGHILTRGPRVEGLVIGVGDTTQINPENRGIEKKTRENLKCRNLNSPRQLSSSEIETQGR